MPESPVAFLLPGRIIMFFCYIDESGTAQIPGNTSHFVLAGFAIPVDKWKYCDSEINKIKSKYLIGNSEIHTAWILRKYIEQTKIPDFQNLDYPTRRREVEKYRINELLKLQKNNVKLYHQTKKNFHKTDNYIHLTFDERKQFIIEVAKLVGSWQFARLFAYCMDKVHFDPNRARNSIDEEAFEQVVSRFETYLQIYSKTKDTVEYGLLIHDNNETICKKHTNMMKNFHKGGTFWNTINNIIETPLFVNSELTGLVQIADLCGYAIRRYLENSENELFDFIFTRADRKNGNVVGVRHFTCSTCECKICKSH